VLGPELTSDIKNMRTHVLGPELTPRYKKCEDTRART